MCIDSPKLRKQPKGSAVGYRAFDVRGDRLRSIYWDEPRAWKRGVNETEDSPAEDRDYGFHALSTLLRAKRLRLRFPGADSVRIHAKVRGSGVVVRHRTGFRSSRMTILRLYVSEFWDAKKTIAALRRFYRVPVEVS